MQKTGIGLKKWVCGTLDSAPEKGEGDDLEVQLGLDPGGQGVVDGLVELDENPESQGRAEHLELHQLVQTLLQGVAWGGWSQLRWELGRCRFNIRY